VEPTFTVAIPAYNAAATIAAALDSVLAQTRGDFEAIVVDDGSFDATAEIVQPFLADSRITLVRQDNRGLARARNAALARARGRYLSLLDSDDVWLPRYLERMGEALDADPDAAFAFCDAWALDDRTRRIRRLTVAAAAGSPPAPADADALLLELLQRNFVFVGATIRRSALLAVGGFDAELRAAEDYDLWLRLAASGRRAVRVPEPLAVYRLRANSLSRDETLMFSSLRRVFSRVAEELDVRPEARASAKRALESIDARTELLAGRRPAAAALRRLRLAAVAVKARLLDGRLWYETPPPDVAAAFPDLRTL
jgi:glycosyltransferase involved in cell wall biosynthesis